MSNAWDRASKAIEAEQGDKWDPYAFHTRATNEHDHSAQKAIPKTLKLPSQMLAALEKAIADPATPYGNVSAFLRDAIAHRLAFLSNEFGVGGEHLKNYLVFYMHESRRNFYDTAQDELEAQIKSLESSLERLCNNERLTLATRIKEVEKMHTHARLLPLLEDLFKPDWESMVDALFAKYYKRLGHEPKDLWDISTLEE